MTFDRRSYLKGSVLAGVGLLGLRGAVTDDARSQNATRDGAPALRGRVCPPGTRELARYSVEDGSFALESGDDVISVSGVNGQGPVRSFSWESSEAVAIVTVRNGPNRLQFEGGFEGDAEVSGPPISSVSFCAPRGGRAVLCELDGMSNSASAMADGLSGITYDTEFHLDGDPSYDYEDEDADKSDAKEDVVHVVSTGHTRDYAHAMVNVVSRTDERVTLADLTKLTLDYYEGEGNEGAMPDEVFLTFLTPGDQLYIAYVHLDNDKQDWETLDVLELIEEGQWHVEDVAFMDIVTSEGAIQTARELRDAPTENLRDNYSGSTLTGVGFGAGNTRNKTAIDRYFDTLHAGWETEDEDDMEMTFEFPALLPLSVDEASRPGQGRGPLEVSLSFTQAEMGVQLGDVIEETVTLHPFGPFAPPPEPGAAAQQVRTDDEELVVRFQPRAVDDVLDGDRFMVSGDFAGENGYSFFATGELE